MDPNINPETGETVASGRSPRFSMWVALTVFSVIVLGASVEVVRKIHAKFVAVCVSRLFCISSGSYSSRSSQKSSHSFSFL
jgi:hypothetical protein